MSMDPQNVLKSKTNQPFGHRRQASKGLGIITNLDNTGTSTTNNTTTTEGVTPEPTSKAKNASFFDTNISIPVPPPRLQSIEPNSAIITPIVTPLEINSDITTTTSYASRLRNIAASLNNNNKKNDQNLSMKASSDSSDHSFIENENHHPKSDAIPIHNNNNNNHSNVRRARSYRFRPPYYHDDDDHDEIMPLPSPLPASTSTSSTSSSSMHSSLLSRLNHEIATSSASSRKTTSPTHHHTNINTTTNTNNTNNTNTNNNNNNNTNNNTNNNNIASPHSPVTPPSPSTSTSIPILSISPTFVSNANTIPRLSEHPMLADVDDQIFIDHIQRQQEQQQQQQQVSKNQHHQKLINQLHHHHINSSNNNRGAMVRETSQSSHYQTLKNGGKNGEEDEDLVDKQVGDFYVKRLLGVGAFSKVYLAEYHHHQRQEEKDVEEEKEKNQGYHNLFAIKTINKFGMLNNPRVRSSIEREVGILKLVDHPQIVHIEATMETEQSLCIILEYAEGVELFNFVQNLYQQRQTNQEKIDEELTKNIFLQLVQVVKWLHKHNIVHRDLKLENIMIHMNELHQPIIKVTDFGLARVIDPDSPKLTTRCGSEEYAAPEIVQSKGYDGRQTDTWALGIILYALLVGYLPFRYDPTKGERVTQMFYRIVRAQVKWPKTWDQYPHLAASPEAKLLVEKILVRQPERRMNLDEVEQSSWFKKTTNDN
ncbi:unnamed protein product [Cunninghamella blakesleeana]